MEERFTSQSGALVCMDVCVCYEDVSTVQVGCMGMGGEEKGNIYHRAYN